VIVFQREKKQFFSKYVFSMAHKKKISKSEKNSCVFAHDFSKNQFF
jgi:hypothetical protein